MKTALSSMILASLLATGAAQAQPAEGSQSYTASVRSGDLNLATPGGLATFHGRVKVAANQICGLAPSLPFYEARSVGECRAQIFRSAERQVTLAMAKSDTTVAGTR